MSKEFQPMLLSHDPQSTEPISRESGEDEYSSNPEQNEDADKVLNKNEEITEPDIIAVVHEKTEVDET